MDEQEKLERAIRVLEGNYKNSVLRHNGELLTVNELISLLKAQEPVAPVEEKRRGGYFRCGNCNARVSKVFEDKYCSQCGWAVKWE